MEAAKQSNRRTMKRKHKSKKNKTQKQKRESATIRPQAIKVCSEKPGFQFRSDNYIKFSKISGYGIFAGKNYKKGDIVEICPFLEIEKKFLEPENPLNQYVFGSHLSPSGDKYILVFGNGSIFNHADENNTYYYHDCTGNRLLYYAAKEDITEGTELCIHYGDKHYVKLYPNFDYQGSRI